MRKLATVAAIACLAPMSLGFGPPAMIESHQASAPLYTEQIAAIRAFQQPSFSAASALVVEGRSGAVLLARDSAGRRPIASLTKMMTALLAIERGHLNDRVKVNVDATKLIDSSVMGLRPGEELSLEDLLYGLLLPSGNDAALAVAEHIGGSVSQFVAQMNRRAAELGMSDTHFTNPHGLDDPENYSSAVDLLVLAQKAMANPEFARIVGTSERTVRGRLAVYQLRNTNKLLEVYPGVLGVKTGSTDAAGECFVAMAQRGDERLFSAVLGSTDRFSDTKSLLDFSFASFECRYLDSPESAFYRLTSGSPEEVALSGGSPSDERGPTVVPAMTGPWECYPVWQARWWHADVSLPDRNDPEPGIVRYYLGDRLIAETAVGRP